MRRRWSRKPCATAAAPPRSSPAGHDGDHRRILATGIARLRAKIKYRPVVFELMPPDFTLLQLQRSVEALGGPAGPQAEFPPPDRAAGTRRGNRRNRRRHRRPAGQAVPLPPRGAGRARRRRHQASALALLTSLMLRISICHDMLIVSINGRSRPDALARTASLYDRVKRVIPPLEWATFADDVEAILDAEARAQRRHPRAQLPDAGDLPRRRRHRRRQPAAGPRGGEGRRRRHRAGRRALHGRDGQAAEPGQDRADPRPRGRLLAGGFDHARRTCGCCGSAIPACRSSPMSTPRPR